MRSSSRCARDTGDPAGSAAPYHRLLSIPVSMGARCCANALSHRCGLRQGTPVILNVRRGFRGRAEAEFDRPEFMTFIKRPRNRVLLMCIELKPKRAHLFGKIDESRSPPPAPFRRID